MHNYKKRLEEKYNKWIYVYQKSPWLIALKMGWWNFMRVPSLAMKQLLQKLPKSHQEVVRGNNALEDLWWRVTPALPDGTVRGKDRQIPALPAGGHIIFDLDQALRLFPEVKRFGLVLFMGMGDYFYATNFIRILHQKYPHIKLDAYVSDHWDQNNSPLVKLCAEKNPLFEHVYTYHGKANAENWKNYHWQGCYSLASTDTLLLPVIYDYTNKIQSRTSALCQTFSLPEPAINPLPHIDSWDTSTQAQEVFDRCKKGCKIVFLQMSSRSAGFTYPYTEELIKKLLQDGFLVITTEKVDLQDPDLLKLDTKYFNITDTISLFRLIKQASISLYVITVFSVLNSVSAGLKIPVLTLQVFIDPAMSSVYYSNMWVVTHHMYPCIPLDRQFVGISEKDYTLHRQWVLYNVSFVKNSFDEMLNQLKAR